MTATEPRTAEDEIPVTWMGRSLLRADPRTFTPKVLRAFVLAIEAEASGAEAEGLDVEAVRLREAIQHFVDTAYPNNGEGRTDRLTWTVPEHAFGRLRAALATPPPAAPAALDTIDALALSQHLDHHTPTAIGLKWPEAMSRCRCGWEGMDWPVHFYGSILARLSSSEAGDGAE